MTNYTYFLSVTHKEEYYKEISIDESKLHDIEFTEKVFMLKFKQFINEYNLT